MVVTDAATDIAGNFLPALKHAQKLFARQDPQQMAAYSGSTFMPAPAYFVVSYCGRPYRISYPEGEVVGNDLPASEQALLLLYLVQARGTPLSGKWISFMQLPGGLHHQAPFRMQAVDPVARAFGNKPATLERIAGLWGAKHLGIGDTGVIIPALPRVPLAFILWTGDEEFPPNANILFDAAAPDYLDTAGLHVLGLNVSRRLVEVTAENNTGRG